MTHHPLICEKQLAAYLVFHDHVLHASCFLAKKLGLVRKVLCRGKPGKNTVPASSTMGLSVLLNTMHSSEAAEASRTYNSEAAESFGHMQASVTFAVARLDLGPCGKATPPCVFGAASLLPIASPGRGPVFACPRLVGASEPRPQTCLQRMEQPQGHVRVSSIAQLAEKLRPRTISRMSGSQQIKQVRLYCAVIPRLDAEGSIIGFCKRHIVLDSGKKTSRGETS